MKNCRCGNRLDSKGYCHECQQYDISSENREVFEKICIICKNRFTDLARYMDHLKSHPQCQFCQDRFISKERLEEHIDSLHKCSLCSEYYPSVSEHVVRTHPYCEFCKKRYLNRAIYEEHMKVHPICEYCGKNFRDKVKLNIHLQETHRCKVCYGSFNNLREHILKNHPFCSLCNRYFIDEPSYRQHNLQEHTHNCVYCNKCFKLKSELENHLTSVHICSDCNTYFPDLRQHFIDKHLYCERCKKPFFTAFEYNRDKEIHKIMDSCVYTLPKPSGKPVICKKVVPKTIKCPYCTRQFATEHAKGQHIKAVHSDKA